MFRKLLSYVLAGVLAMGLVGISSATAAVAPKITKAASLPLVINSGAKARVNPAVANLKATRTYTWYLNGERIDTGSDRILQTFKEDRGFKIFAIESLKFANKKVLRSRTNTVTVGQEELYLWSQEFNEPAGTGVNASAFNLTSDYVNGDGVASGNAGWGNNERQWYTNSMANTDGQGNMVLTAAKTTGADNYNCYYGKCTWKSAKLVTYNKVSFRYGRIEVRAKVSGGTGQWPAIWMLGVNQPQVGWPTCGEIDIAEFKGHLPNTLWGTLHGPNYLNRGNVTTINGGFSQFHTYRIDWVPNKISWYIDDVKFHEMKSTDIGGNNWVFNADQYLILNVAMGGNFVGNTIDGNLTTTTMTVDYVRHSKIDGIGSVTKY